jgi:cytoskeleton protein RodZ
MTSIGDTLRRERQRRNLDLPEIAGQLKISVRFLEAIEHDDFGKLPGGVFTKSFVRQYADLLGLDADEMAAEVEHVMEPEPVLSEMSGRPKPDVPGIELQMGEESWQSVRERPVALPSWFRAGLLLVTLMLVCSGVYWWFQRPHHPVLAHQVSHPPKPAAAAPPVIPVSQPVLGPPATASSTISPPPSTQASAEPTSTPTPTPAAATPDVPNPPPNPNATVRVGITADEVVWIRADINGKYQFSGTLQPHETRSIDADGQVILRLGNAGGATITLNGKPVGAVGPKGQIRTVQFTSGGFQIVSAEPKLLDPLDRL